MPALPPHRAIRPSLVLATLLSFVTAAHGQAPAFDDHARAIHAVETAIRTTYVFAELKPALTAKLEESLASHRYDGLDADLFAQRVTEDLQAVSHDGHLYLAHDPAHYAALLAPQKSDHGMAAYYRAISIRENSGLTKMEIGPGNIRYLKIAAFHWTPKLTRQNYDDAARFLKDGAAVIIDLRDNGGGDSDAADYFLKTIARPNKTIPFYILINGRVGSAAEAVTYDVQQARQGIIVGSTSYGAANNNKHVPIAPDMVLSISYHRPINPISKTNWEGTGVVPDIAVPASTAYDAAVLASLDVLSKAPGVTPSTLAEYDWARTAIAARLPPVSIEPSKRKMLAGHYGSIDIRDQPEGLRLYRSDRPRWQQGLLLTPMNEAGLFSLEGSDELRVRLNPQELVLLHGSEDAREVFAKTP